MADLREVSRDGSGGLFICEPGGGWGAWLKYAGYDGLAVVGAADKPVYILINDGGVEIRDASFLWGKTTVETQDLLQEELGKEAKVLTIGPAGENMVSFSTVLASGNASGSSGFGAVMGSKSLKAVVVNIHDRIRPAAADPDILKSLADRVYRLRTENYENYGHANLDKRQLTACYGCISGCDRQEFEDENGKRYKHFCQAASVYMGPALKYYDENEAVEVNRLTRRLCDQYRLDTAVLEHLIAWLGRCHEAGLLNEEEAVSRSPRSAARSLLKKW